MPYYTQCPICSCATLTPYLTVQDESISNQQFNLVQCPQCNVVLTQDAPNQDDIAAYYASTNYVSHTNTKRGIINYIYHKVRTITLRQKLKWITQYTQLKQGNILDIGAGTGAFIQLMNKHQWHSTGIEPDASARTIAANVHNVTLLSTTALKRLPHYQYHAITLWHVLEHVHELNEYGTMLHNLLHTNGKIFIAVPNYTSYDAQHYKAKWAAYDVPRHLYHFSPRSIEQYAAKHGFNLIATKPMWYDSVYVSMLSEKYKKGNILKAITIGYISNLKALFNIKNCSSLVYILQKK